MDATGKVVASSTQAAGQSDTPQGLAPSSLTEGLVIAPPRWNTGYATATLSVAVPVLSYDNLLMGALVAVLNLYGLQPRLKSAIKSPSGEVILLDSDGRALASSQTGTDKLLQLDPSVLRHLLAQPGNSMSFQGLTHRNVIGLAEVSAEPGVTIVAELDRAEVYGKWIDCEICFWGW